MMIIFTSIQNQKLDRYYRFACKEMLTLAHNLNQDNSNTYHGAIIESSKTTFIGPKNSQAKTFANRMSISVVNITKSHNIKSVFAATLRPIHDDQLMLMIIHKRNTQLTNQDQKIEDQLIQTIKQQVPSNMLRIQIK